MSENVSPMSSAAEAKDWKRYYKLKDVRFAVSKAVGVWAADSCPSCNSRGGCCNHYNHHLGDCCLHCGNDERKL